MHGTDCSVLKMNHMPLLLTYFQEFKQYKSGLLLFHEPFCFHNLCPPISVIVNINHSSHDCFTVYIYEGPWTVLEKHNTAISLQSSNYSARERTLLRDFCRMTHNQLSLGHLFWQLVETCMSDTGSLSDNAK